MFITRKAYAQHRGVSPQAVHKAIKAGRISIGDDMLIDPEVADREWEASRSMRGGRRAKVTDAPPEPYKHVPADAIRAVVETTREGDAGADAISGDEGEPVTLTRARIANEILRAKRQKLAYEVERGALVDRKRVEIAVFNLARQERDAWMNFPSRESARIAASLGVSEADTFRELDRAVRAYLAILAEVNLET